MIERLYDEYIICLFRYISKKVYVRIGIWGIEYIIVRVTFWKRPSVKVGRPLCLACSSSRVGALPAAFTRGRHGGRARPSTLKTYPSPPEQSLWQNIPTCNFILYFIPILSYIFAEHILFLHIITYCKALYTHHHVVYFTLSTLMLFILVYCFTYIFRLIWWHVII
jgi:hypothetical protein